ncbi:MAG TPA: hypothetical protein PLB58_07935 [Bacilli bacterium]|nr:hypothetical protein [Bacilli bacterium]
MSKNSLIGLLFFMLILFFAGCGKTLPVPEDFEMNDTIITWSEVEGAEKYRIELENVVTGELLKRIVSPGDDLKNLDIPPGEYRVKLQAVGKKGESAFTEALEFTLEGADSLSVLEGAALIDNQYVKWTGRTHYDAETGANILYHSASAFEVHFSGPEVKATLTATNTSVNYKRPFIVIVLDDNFENARTVELTKAETEVTLAEGIEDDAEHKVTVYKRNESIDSHIGVKKIATTGVFIPKVEYRERLIEFIAASSSTGYGNLGAADDGKTTANSDALRAYAFLTAKALNADISIYAASGWGVKFSYWTNPHTLNIFDAYKKVDFFSDVDWHFGTYFPDVIVMNLGTNDWSYINHAEDPNERNRRMEDFKDQYARFIKFVHGLYPDAEIIILYGLMNETNIFDATEEIYNEVKATVPKLHLFYTNGDGKGSSNHPSAASHERIADALTNEIKEIMNW